MFSAVKSHILGNVGCTCSVLEPPLSAAATQDAKHMRFKYVHCLCTHEYGSNIYAKWSSDDEIEREGL